jgi:nifR3 family TIM-barrel protein
MAEACRKLEGMGFPMVDINMGCPVPKVVREGAGAALLKDPSKVASVVRACVQAVKIPVTIKIRSGWDDGTFTGIDVAKAAEDAGAQLITIHARKRAQFHSGVVDHKAIAAVKQAVKIPIVGNGSVVDAASALKMLDESGCDAVMVGRGCFGQPWVFREIAAAIRGEAPPPPPSIDEVAEVMRWHLERTYEVEPFRADGLTRKYVAWYLHGVPYGTFFRDRAFRSRGLAEMRALIDEFIAHKRACVGISHADRAPIPGFVADLLAKGVVPKEPPTEETCETE